MEHLDLADPQTYLRGVPHSYFAWLRANDPVHWQPEIEGPGYWAVTRHADVTAVSRDAEIFSSGAKTALLMELPPEALSFMQQQLIHMDAPRHSELRNVVKHAFTPKAVRRLECQVQAIAAEVVAGIAGAGRCDFVTEVAADLPLQVLAELLGVPQQDRWKMFDWSNRLIGLEDPEYGSPEDAMAALGELLPYASSLAAKRRLEPGSDIFSLLVQSTIDGKPLSDIELNMFFYLLVVAGNETTRNLISGGMLALCEHPDQRARLLEHPDLMSCAVEEMLRWVTPVMQFRRTAMKDTVVGDQSIAEGDKIVMYYSSANRDESVFDEPFLFDISRSPNPHLGFGFGPHFCLGSSLARIEIAAIFKEILSYMPNAELDGDVVRLKSNFIAGIKHLPIRWKPSVAGKSLAG